MKNVLAYDFAVLLIIKTFRCVGGTVLWQHKKRCQRACLVSSPVLCIKLVIILFSSLSGEKSSHLRIEKPTSSSFQGNAETPQLTEDQIEWMKKRLKIRLLTIFFSSKVTTANLQMSYQCVDLVFHMWYSFVGFFFYLDVVNRFSLLLERKWVGDRFIDESAQQTSRTDLSENTNGKMMNIIGSKSRTKISFFSSWSLFRVDWIFIHYVNWEER